MIGLRQDQPHRLPSAPDRNLNWEHGLHALTRTEASPVVIFRRQVK